MRVTSPSPNSPKRAASPPSLPKHAHAGWDLPPHLIQLMSLPVETALKQLIDPPPPPPASNGFLDAMRTEPAPAHNFTLTENGALAHASTESALVDLFFDFAPNVDPTDLYRLLEKAWKEDSLSTMKIVFHARSIHEGKGFEEGFFRAMAWVFEHHPKTLLENLHYVVKPTCERQRDSERDAKLAKKKMDKKGKDDFGVVEMEDEDMEEQKEYPARPHGCFDDLNDMLVLYVNGQFKPTYKGKLDAINQALAPSTQKKLMKMVRERNVAGTNNQATAPFKAPRTRHQKPTDTNASRKAMWAEKTKIGKQTLCRERFDKLIGDDKKFQALYIVIVGIFASQLQADLKLYNENRQSKSTSAKETSKDAIFGLSFAAKWAGTPGKGTDKQLMISSAIALSLFPGDGIKSARRRFQAEVLSPLRAALSVPEVRMSANEWDKVEYNKVPSRSMERNTPHFARHDQVGFDKYLDKVAEGQSTMSGAAMFPHQVLMSAMDDNVIKSKVADMQWRTLVQSIRNSSKSSIKNCLAIADVSGSMGSISRGNVYARGVNNPAPIYPCVALTLLLSELAVEPWRGSFFTFSESPSLEYIEPTLPLSQRSNKLSRSAWGMNTNFYAVFQLILTRAKSSQLAPDDMIRTLFVFSDMQFDEAGGCSFGETQYQRIKREFDEAGYRIPEIIFWNLDSRDGGTPKPVTAGQTGVSLMSGYSGSLMKYFLDREDGDEEMVEVEVEIEVKDESGSVQKVMTKTKTVKENNPFETMMAVISKPSFAGVVVVD